MAAAIGQAVHDAAKAKGDLLQHIPTDLRDVVDRLATGWPIPGKDPDDIRVMMAQIVATMEDASPGATFTMSTTATGVSASGEPVQTAQRWDDLSSAEQERIQEHYVRAYWDREEESQVEQWRENDAQGAARQEVLDDLVWQQDTIKEELRGMGADPAWLNAYEGQLVDWERMSGDNPYDDSFELQFESGNEAELWTSVQWRTREDLEADPDPTVSPNLRTWPPYTPPVPGQGDLPGVGVAAGGGWSPVQAELEARLGIAFHTEQERRQGEIDPPDLSEEVRQSLTEDWDSRSDAQRMDYANEEMGFSEGASGPNASTTDANPEVKLFAQAADGSPLANLDFNIESNGTVHWNFVKAEAGHGFAAKLLPAVMAGFKSAGVTSVEYLAASGGGYTGAYMWAKLGGEYQSDYARDSHARSFQHAMSALARPGTEVAVGEWSDTPAMRTLPAVQRESDIANFELSEADADTHFPKWREALQHYPPISEARRRYMSNGQVKLGKMFLTGQFPGVAAWDGKFSL